MNKREGYKLDVIHREHYILVARKSSQPAVCVEDVHNVPLSCEHVTMMLESSELQFKSVSYFRPKDLPPLCPTPVPARPDNIIDLESGRHFSSFKEENNVASSIVISPSLILLHEITLSLLSSFQERTTGSKPSIVSNEHPSKERSLTLLQNDK